MRSVAATVTWRALGALCVLFSWPGLWTACFLLATALFGETDTNELQRIVFSTAASVVGSAAGLLAAMGAPSAGRAGLVVLVAMVGQVSFVVHLRETISGPLMAGCLFGSVLCTLVFVFVTGLSLAGIRGTRGLKP